MLTLGLWSFICNSYRHSVTQKWCTKPKKRLLAGVNGPIACSYLKQKAFPAFKQQKTNLTDSRLLDRQWKNRRKKPASAPDPSVLHTVCSARATLCVCVCVCVCEVIMAECVMYRVSMFLH